MTTRSRGLQVMHGHIHHLPDEWARHLEGSYFPLGILRSVDRRGEPLRYLTTALAS